jgi:hypothetical protein
VVRSQPDFKQANEYLISSEVRAVTDMSPELKAVPAAELSPLLLPDPRPCHGQPAVPPKRREYHDQHVWILNGNDEGSVGALERFDCLLDALTSK